MDVIDVQRQTDVKMQLHEFIEYFLSPARTTVLNLISLEFSNTRYVHVKICYQVLYLQLDFSVAKYNLYVKGFTSLGILRFNILNFSCIFVVDCVELAIAVTSYSVLSGIL